MSLKYHLIQKSNPRDLQAQRKFYAQAVTKDRVSIRQLAQEIADISTVSTVDTIAVIESFIQLIPKHLAEGEIVRLGDFGSFAVRLSSEGAETEEDFKESMIKNIKIRFHPDQQIKKVLSMVDFERQP